MTYCAGCCVWGIDSDTVLWDVRVGTNKRGFANETDYVISYVRSEAEEISELEVYNSS
jgi:hypothetical protein